MFDAHQADRYNLAVSQDLAAASECLEANDDFAENIIWDNTRNAALVDEIWAQEDAAELMGYAIAVRSIPAARAFLEESIRRNPLCYSCRAILREFDDGTYMARVIRNQQLNAVAGLPNFLNREIMIDGRPATRAHIILSALQYGRGDLDASFYWIESARDYYRDSDAVRQAEAEMRQIFRR